MILLDDVECPSPTKSDASSQHGEVHRGSDMLLLNSPLHYDPPPRYAPTERTPLWRHLESGPVHALSTKSSYMRRFWMAFAITALLLGATLAPGITIFSFRKPTTRHRWPDIRIPLPSVPESSRHSRAGSLPHTPHDKQDVQIIGERRQCNTWRHGNEKTLHSDLTFTFKPHEFLFLQSADILARDSGNLKVAFQEDDSSTDITVNVRSSYQNKETLFAYHVCLLETQERWTLAISEPSYGNDFIQFDIEVLLPRDFHRTLHHLHTNLQRYSHVLGQSDRRMQFDTIRIVSSMGAVSLESVSVREIDVYSGVRDIRGSCIITEYGYMENHGTGINVDVYLQHNITQLGRPPEVLLIGGLGPVTATITLLPPIGVVNPINIPTYSGRIINSASTLNAAIFYHTDLLIPPNLNFTTTTSLAPSHLYVDPRFSGEFSAAIGKRGPTAQVNVDESVSHPGGGQSKRLLRYQQQEPWHTSGIISWDVDDDAPYVNTRSVQSFSEAAPAALHFSNFTHPQKWREFRNLSL